MRLHNGSEMIDRNHYDLHALAARHRHPFLGS